MRNDQYPIGSVRALLDSGLVGEPARLLLKSRLERKDTIDPVFFDQNAYETVRSVCMRLIPQNDREEQIDLAGMLDEYLAGNEGNGWRYDQMPADQSAFISGIIGINQASEQCFGKEFKLLSETEQDRILTTIQSGEAEGQIWSEIPSTLFFEELLATLVELYYSHPIAKEEIGEVAFADAKGWNHIGLNEHEAHEPLPVKKGD